MFVNSGTYQEPLRRIVIARAWDRYFQGVFGSPASKVENLERIVASQSARPEEVALVGDSPIDEEAAISFGCRFIAFRFTESNEFGVTRIDHLPQLPDVL